LNTTKPWPLVSISERITGSGRILNFSNASVLPSLYTATAGDASSPRMSMLVPERCRPTTYTGTASGATSRERRHRYLLSVIRGRA
jgi:hypothetical protein